MRRDRRDALLAADVEGKRFVLVNGLDAWVDYGDERQYLTAQRYAPDVVSPIGALLPAGKTERPWSTVTWKLPGGPRMTQETCGVPGRSLAAVRWCLVDKAPDVRVSVRLFLSGRVEDAVHRRNDAFRWNPEVRGWRRTWRPYDGVPDIAAYTRAAYRHDPHWYDNFIYEDGATEDLASPGIFEGTVSATEGLEIVLAGGWGEVIEGMILPEVPVLWTAPAPTAARKSGTKRG